MLVDAHCHLDFEEFDGDRDDVVKRAGDTIIVNSIIGPKGVEKGLRLAEKYNNVYVTLGFGADNLDECEFNQTVKLIKENYKHIVGLGEVGLDYYWVKDKTKHSIEKSHFNELVRLSLDLDLPLVVHSRDSESECINIIEKLKTTAMMHCFSGTVEEARKAVDLGCLISIPTNVTYVKSRQKIASVVPLDSMVLETDAPYLSPIKGLRNEPANVKAAAEKIAKLRGIGFSRVQETTTENALSFFRIKT